eukprot:CAMPEP_0117444016 /NCGR_PEP_ID=MMETSP0759-20121206/5010_1 /TAXON_ID=63605 /ORGANISM="Percolomonas cosmopolitus, Strain WS" /LENGTH=647 /DNA_ID=CAMNT_0005236043 /DNA_START=133 /DNA_END=2076 /DNA_ORIENTATION=-
MHDRLKSLRKRPEVLQRAKQLQNNQNSANVFPILANRIPTSDFHAQLANHYQRYTNDVVREPQGGQGRVNPRGGPWAPPPQQRQHQQPPAQQQGGRWIESVAPAVIDLATDDEEEDDDFFDALDLIEEKLMEEKKMDSLPPVVSHSVAPPEISSLEDDDIMIVSTSAKVESDNSNKRKRDLALLQPQKKKRKSSGMVQSPPQNGLDRHSGNVNVPVPRPTLPSQQVREKRPLKSPQSIITNAPSHLPPQRSTKLPPQLTVSNKSPPPQQRSIHSLPQQSKSINHPSPHSISVSPIAQQTLNNVKPSLQTPSPVERLSQKSSQDNIHTRSQSPAPPPLPKIGIPSNLSSLVSFMSLGVNFWKSYNFLSPACANLPDDIFEGTELKPKGKEKEKMPILSPKTKEAIPGRKGSSTRMPRNLETVTSTSGVGKKQRKRKADGPSPSVSAIPPNGQGEPPSTLNPILHEYPHMHIKEKRPPVTSQHGKSAQPLKGVSRTRSPARTRTPTRPREKRVLGTIPIRSKKAAEKKASNNNHRRQHSSPAHSDDIEQSDDDDSKFDDSVEYFSSLDKDPSQADSLHSGDTMDDDDDDETGSLNEFVTQESHEQDDHADFVPTAISDDDEDLAHVVDENDTSSEQSDSENVESVDYVR